MWNGLLDLIYPPYLKCIFCNEPLNGGGKYSICETCYGEIPFIAENSCIICSKPFSISTDISICEECSKEKHYYKNVLSPVQYDGNIKKLVFSYKYNYRNYLGRYMAEMMADLARNEKVYGDMILAVPLHPNREKPRGYNQAHILAKYISKELDIYYGRDYIIRTKDTEALYKFTKTQRKIILEDAFHLPIKSAIKNKDILLIDDIYTTGSTVNACSKVLIESGAKSITVLTFARGI